MAKESGQKFFGKIGLKLTIPYFAISFFTLLVIGGFIYYQYQAGIRAAEQEEKSRAAAAAVEADSFFANIFSELQLLGKNITCPTCTVANDQELSNLIASNPDIYEISVIDVNGQELSKISQYNSSTTLENVSLQDKFKSALVSNSYLGPVHYSIYNLPLITVSYSLSDKSGDKIGVISGEIDLSKLWSSIFQNQLSQTGYFYVVDQSGSLIAAKDQDLVSQKPNLRESKGVSNFLNNDSTPAIYSSFNKQKVLGQWELIQSTGWGLLAEIPLKEILQNAWILWTVGGVSFLLFLLFMGAAFFLINKNLLSPLRSFASAVDEVKKGNYGYRINISSEDELGYLADIFNQTASQLRETHARLEDATKARTGELDKVIANLWKKNLQMKDEETAMTNLLEDARILQDQLTEEKDRISAIIAYMGEGLIATDKMGTINIVNPAAERMLEITRDKIIGRNIDDVVPLYIGNECKNRVLCEERPIMKVIKNGKIFISSLADDYYFQSNTGRKIAISLASSPLLKDEKVVGAVTIFRDITTEKRLDDAKTSFISIASHQLRTPLTSMRWFSEMLISGDAGAINAEQKKFVDRIYQGTERMISLVNLLLQIARVEAGRVKIEPIAIDFHSIIQGVMTTLKSPLQEKAQKVKITLEPDPFPKIMMDQEVVWQVFQNLISNASRYSPDKGVITVAGKKKDELVEFSVADKGIGIPEDAQDRIFNKFFRAENALKLVPEGSGLGLSLVKSLVEGWGGKIWFKSQKGKGTVFYFTIPLAGMRAKEGEVGLAV